MQAAQPVEIDTLVYLLGMDVALGHDLRLVSELVRRYIGKGKPPRELASSTDIIAFVQATPGAIGYVEEADLKSGANVLLRK